MQPESISELASMLMDAERVSVVGYGSLRPWGLPEPLSTEICTAALTGIIDYSPNDQVVNVRAGTPLQQLQLELATNGQCLPLLQHYIGSELAGTVGGALSINLPHLLEGECGSWRDWVLGMTVVLADGTIAKSGSHAVKNVAGYDIHKLMIGARGTLAVVAEVILRTYPIKSLPEPNVRYTQASGGVDAPCQWIQRVRLTDFAQASAVASSFAGVDIPRTSTLVRFLPLEIELPRFEGDWILRSNSGDQNLQITAAATIHSMKRAKAILDPHNKLNGGAMGIF